MQSDDFDSGYETFAQELLDFLMNYEQDGDVPVVDIEEFVNLSLGWDPEDE